VRCPHTGGQGPKGEQIGRADPIAQKQNGGNKNRRSRRQDERVLVDPSGHEDNLRRGL
jgi:hypothetical protein